MGESSIPALRDLTAFGSALASRRGAYQQVTYGRKLAWMRELPTLLRVPLQVRRRFKMQPSVDRTKELHMSSSFPAHVAFSIKLCCSL